MRAIRGNTQVMSGTLPFAAVNETFHNELFQKKAIADFVQSATPVAAIQGAGNVVVTALIPVGQTTANVSGTNLSLAAADLGYIAGAVGAKAAKTRVILRNSATQGAIVDAAEREIYGYLVVDGEDTKIEFYVWDGDSEEPATLPANVNIEFQAMRRFTFDSVGEDFGANEKWAMGIVDTTTALNLEQLARDLYGADWALNGNGVQIATDGTSGLFDLFSAHLQDGEDAHDASAVSFVSGSTGINALHVQGALEQLKNLMDNADTAVSGSLIDALNAHIGAATAHSGSQIGVAYYSGTTGGTLAAGDLQTALHSLVDRIRSNYMLIDTHMTEDNAHRARNIDVEVSGTALANHFGTSGTVNLQAFLADLESHLHSSIDAVSGTASGDASALQGQLLAQSGTFRTDISALQADLLAQSGTQVSEDARLEGLISAQSGTFRTDVVRLDADLLAQSGTFRTDVVRLDGDLLAQSGTFRADVARIDADALAQSGTFRADVVALEAADVAMSGTFRADVVRLDADLLAQSGTFRTDVVRLDGDLLAQSGTFRADVVALQADLLAQSGTQVLEDERLAGLILAQSGTFRSDVVRIDADILAQSGTFRADVVRVDADILAQSGTFRADVVRLDADVLAQSGTLRTDLTVLDNRMEALLGITDGATEMAFVGPYVSGTNDVTEAINAIATALQGASSGAGADVTRIEGLLGVTTGAGSWNADGTFLSGTTVKDDLQALDTEIVHVMNKMGVNLVEDHAVTFTSLSGTQVVADTDTFAVAIDKVRANLEAHQASTEAHDAASITFASGTSPASMIPAANVQDALMNVGRRLYTLEQETVESEDLTCVALQTTYALAYAIKASTKPLVIINGIVQKYGVDFTVDNNGAGGAGQVILTVAVESGDTMEVWYKKVVVLA